MTASFSDSPVVTEPRESGPPHEVAELVALFEQLFAERYRTCLQAGGGEPLYSPAPSAGGWHRIIFTRDYFASALHEVAHWCIAGGKRRQQVDYGYWYAPDGRKPAQQRAFERAEVKPQALEWIFSRATDFPFRLSADNLEARGGPSAYFRHAVWRQVRVYCDKGLPRRAADFAAALAEAYGTAGYLDPAGYRLECL